MDNLLNEEAKQALKDYVDITEEGNSIECVEDPKVYGAVAVKVTRGEDTFHLLWTNDGCGDFDSVEFESWPPTSGEPQFFI